MRNAESRGQPHVALHSLSGPLQVPMLCATTPDKAVQAPQRGSLRSDGGWTQGQEH